MQRLIENPRADFSDESTTGLVFDYDFLRHLFSLVQDAHPNVTLNRLRALVTGRRSTASSSAGPMR